LGKDFEDFGEEVLDGFGVGEEAMEPFIEEEEEIARFKGEALFGFKKALLVEGPEDGETRPLALDGGGVSIEEERGEFLAFLGVLVLGEKLVHFFKTGFFSFGHVDVEEGGFIWFWKIEEKAAGTIGEKGERFDGDGIGTAFVDVFLEHEVLKEHRAFVFSVHPFAEEGVFFEAVDVFEEALAHGVESIGEFGDFFGAGDGDRFAVVAGGDGKGRVIESLDRAGNFVGDEVKGGDHEGDGAACAEKDEEEALLEFFFDEIDTDVGGKDRFGVVGDGRVTGHLFTGRGGVDRGDVGGNVGRKRREGSEVEIGDAEFFADRLEFWGDFPFLCIEENGGGENGRCEAGAESFDDFSIPVVGEESGDEGDATDECGEEKEEQSSPNFHVGMGIPFWCRQGRAPA
jgi:hypothetical protein